MDGAVHPERDLADGTIARARTYKLLSLAFAFPDEDLFEAIRDGTFATVLRETQRLLPYPGAAEDARALTAAGDSYGAFEAEYIRLFEIGPGGPPCPLHGGVYVGERMQVMEEATRFYRFFHLRLTPELRELPDHVTTELEFLHYLAFREAEVLQSGGDPGSLVRAQRDFLDRHLDRWLPALQERLGRQRTLAFFPALVDCTARHVRTDLAWAASRARDA